MDDYQKIRKFETDILDRFHEKYPFFQYQENVIIPYILQVYGDTERYKKKLIQQVHNDVSLSVFFNNMLHGMGHCIRWIVNKDTLNLKDISNETFQ